MKHIEVVCPKTDCSWQGGEYNTVRMARAVAKQHVEHTGHDTRISVTTEEWITPTNIG